MAWGFDHIVVRCRNVEVSLAFYGDLLGLTTERLEEWRAGTAPFPSVRVTPGVVIDLFPAEYGATAGDNNQRVDHFCLTLDSEGFQSLQTKLADAGVAIETGPDLRWGAMGDGLSIYFRDPDGLTVEVRTYEY